MCQNAKRPGSYQNNNETEIWMTRLNFKSRADCQKAQPYDDPGDSGHIILLADSEVNNSKKPFLSQAW
jgi:hypothetical protein